MTFRERSLSAATSVAIAASLAAAPSAEGSAQKAAELQKTCALGVYVNGYFSVDFKYGQPFTILFEDRTTTSKKLSQQLYTSTGTVLSAYMNGKRVDVINQNGKQAEFGYHGVQIYAIQASLAPSTQQQAVKDYGKSLQELLRSNSSNAYSWPNLKDVKTAKECAATLFEKSYVSEYYNIAIVRTTVKNIIEGRVSFPKIIIQE